MLMGPKLPKAPIASYMTARGTQVMVSAAAKAQGTSLCLHWPCYALQIPSAGCIGPTTDQHRTYLCDGHPIRALMPRNSREGSFS